MTQNVAAVQVLGADVAVSHLHRGIRKHSVEFQRTSGASALVAHQNLLGGLVLRPLCLPESQAAAQSPQRACCEKAV